MRRAERLAAILKRIAATGSVDVLELSSTLRVSGATIRRDLQSLSSSRLLVRTHGGAVANHIGDGLPLSAKPAWRHAEKRRIGQAAACLVDEAVVIGMTGGSTAKELAKSLSSRVGITVVTNAINVAAEFVGHSALRLVVIGGVVRRSDELVGPTAEAMLENYHLDIVFIGVDGITPTEGCTTHDEMEAQTDLAFLRRARRRVVITDSSKIGKVTFARIAPLSGITDIITDRDADPEQLCALRNAGPNVITV